MQRSRPDLSKFLNWMEGSTPLNLGKVGLKSGRLSRFKLKNTNIGPLRRGRGAVELEDLEYLIDFAVSAEKRLLFSQFSEDASHSPDINSQAVLFLSQEDFRGTIPKGLDLMGEGLDGETEGACESEICDFEGAGLIDEKILGFKVSVDDATGVAVVDAVAELVEEQFDLILTHAGFVFTQPFLEVVIDQFKDEVEFLLGRNVDNFSKTESQTCYWTMLGWGCSSLRMEISRMAVEGTPSSSFSSLIFFMATTWLLWVSLALNTTP